MQRKQYFHHSPSYLPPPIICSPQFENASENTQKLDFNGFNGNGFSWCDFSCIPLKYTAKFKKQIVIKKLFELNMCWI